METKFNKKLIAAAVAVSGLALLSGCGSSGSSAVPIPAGAGVAGIGGGCVPITQTTMIGFNATNMYLGNPQLSGDSRVLAGIIPPGDSLATGNYGTMVVIPGNVAPPVPTAYSQSMNFQASRVDGTTLSLNVTNPQAMPTTLPQYGGYGSNFGAFNNISGSVNSTGYIQISSFVQTLIVQMAMGYTSNGGGYVTPFSGIGGYGNTGYGGYPAGYSPTGAVAPQICVSNLAFSLQRTNASFGNWLYMGTVYFYITGGVLNGQHGLALNF